jgi:hypothetical protein
MRIESRATDRNRPMFGLDRNFPWKFWITIKHVCGASQRCAGHRDISTSLANRLRGAMHHLGVTSMYPSASAHPDLAARA